jgi:hypothetical protein
LFRLFSVGALLLLLSDVVLLSQLAVYRDSGFTPEFPADIIAVGRTSEAIDSLSGYLGSVGDLVLAVALLGLAGALERPVALLARVLAVVLLVAVITWYVGPSPVHATAAVVAGLVLGRSPSSSRAVRCAGVSLPSGPGNRRAHRRSLPHRRTANLA